MSISPDRPRAADDGLIFPLTAAALSEMVVRAGETLVASALLLPAQLRAIAGCAGLTYVQPMRVVEYTEARAQLWLCQVAAQVHYLDRRGYTFRVLLDSSLLASATRYEPRWHGCMPTVDLRDLVEDTATAVLCEQQQQELSLPIAARDLMLALAPLAGYSVQEAPVLIDEPVEECVPVASQEMPAVVVPIAVLHRVGRDALRQAKERHGRRPALPVLLLRAVEEVLRGKREIAVMAKMEWQVRALSREIAQVRRLLRTWRRSWASVHVIAQYERGRYGALEACRVSVHVPTEQAA